jgi:hypothetical protein
VPAPGLAADEEEERPFALFLAFQRFDRGAAALRKGERRARRCAAVVEGRAQRRSPAAQMLLGLACGETLHPHREAPRRGIAGELPVPELRLV